MYTDEGSISSSVELASALRAQLHAFVAPLLRQLDLRLDARLVRTFEAALEAILVFRNRAMGLLLSELGAYLLSPEHAPAGTKRLSNLLRSAKWDQKLVGRYLWEQAEERLKEIERAGETPLLLWDQSVLEKPESIQAEGLCAVRSSKAARLKRIKPGFYNPPGGRPVFVPGYEWLCVLLAGPFGPVQVALMQWWTKRGEHATDLRTLQAKVMGFCAREWKKRVLNVFDRGHAGDFWLSTLLYLQARFVVRWPGRYHLLLRNSGRPEGTRSEGTKNAKNAMNAKNADAEEAMPAWRMATGKKAWDHKELLDTHTKNRRTIQILAFPVLHPKHETPLWLVVARSGHGREPWYLLTGEKVETAEEAWKVYFAYHRRWQVEMCFRFTKCELAMESPRLWSFENRLKLLAMVVVVYAFLLHLLRLGSAGALEAYHALLDHFCHRTGKRSREASAPLYRLRAALSRLWLAFPRQPGLSPQSTQPSAHNSG